MSILSDLKILYHLAKPGRGSTQRERMESFYSGQASEYDAFRRRLLQGREELYRNIPTQPGAIWVDLGGGTGVNLEFIQDRLESLKKIYLVDLSPSLLQVARKRIANRGWKQVEAVEEDATRFMPREGCADVVTFSYSLTMIPDWFAAVDQAWRMLRPGGVLGVVDFYIARKHPDGKLQRQGWLTRSLWPLWFATDNVFLSPDHLPYLEKRFEPISIEEKRARLPYLFWTRTPYYRFVGRKSGDSGLEPLP